MGFSLAVNIVIGIGETLIPIIRFIAIGIGFVLVRGLKDNALRSVLIVLNDLVDVVHFSFSFCLLAYLYCNQF